MRDDDLDFVVTHFLDPRGDVVYRDFVASVEAAADGGDDEPAAPAPHRQTRADAGDVLRDALKAQVRAGVDYRAAFEKEDGAYSGVLSSDAFARVLRALGCRLDASDLDALENRYRAATRGGVHYVELLNGVLPVRPEAGEAWRERDLFAAMDLDGDGWVEYPEFLVFVKDPCHAFLEQKVRYLSHKRKLTPRDAADALADVDGNGARLAARFDPSEDGNVDGGRFLRFLKGDSEAGGAADAPPGLRALRSAIDRLAERRGRAPDYARVFDDFDADGSGKLEPREFKRALKALGFEDLGADDVRTPSRPSTATATAKSTSASSWPSPRAAGARTRSGRTGSSAPCARSSSASAGRRSCGGPSGHGRERLGKLSRRELGRALDDLGFRLDRADVDALMARFDRDGDGKVSWKEFVAFAEGGGAALLEGDVDDVLDRLKNAVADAKRDGLKVADCFDAFDRDGSGDVDEREFQRA
ncbi:Ca2-binding protein [Aureococcus anophagefferens]|nr:Ca2-binding protein [Aureococcus anophagefferens]